MAAEQVILLDSATYTASGTGAKTAVKTASMAAVVVDVTAVSAGTYLRVWLEGTADGGTNWTAFAPDQIVTNAADPGAPSSAATKIYDTAGTGRTEAIYKHVPWDYIRARWALSGTSYTFSVKAVVK